MYSSNYTLVPATWTCPREFYGTNDGCDCSCGDVDPDCKGLNNTCGCIGTQNGVSSVKSGSLFIVYVLFAMAILFL